MDVLPPIKCWPLDADRYITLPQFFTHSLKTGQRNVGTYRLQKLTPHTLAMHWQIHHDGAAHYREYRQAGQQMPVAIALGGDPVMSYTSVQPLRLELMSCCSLVSPKIERSDGTSQDN